MAIQALPIQRPAAQNETAREPTKRDGAEGQPAAGLPLFHRKGEADGRGGDKSGNNGQGEKRSAPRATLTGIFRTRQTQNVSRSEAPADSVLHNLGGTSTFDRTRWHYGMRADFEAGGKYSSLQGKRLRVAGELDASDAKQISNNKLMAQVNEKPFNPDRIAFYNAIPMRA